LRSTFLVRSRWFDVLVRWALCSDFWVFCRALRSETNLSTRSKRFHAVSMTAMVTIMNCSRLFVCIAYLKRFVFRAITFVADQALWSVSSRTLSHRHVLYEIYLKPVRRILFSLNSEIKTLLASEIFQSQDMEQRPWRSSIMIPIKWWLRTVKIDEKLLRLNLQRLVGMNHSHCVPQDWVSAQGVSTPFKLQPNILRTYEKVRNQLLIG